MIATRMHNYVRPTFVNTLFPVNRLRLFLATASRFSMELIFEILRYTPVISELHLYFWHACITS